MPKTAAFRQKNTCPGGQDKKIGGFFWFGNLKEDLNRAKGGLNKDYKQDYDKSKFWHIDSTSSFIFINDIWNMLFKTVKKDPTAGTF